MGKLADKIKNLTKAARSRREPIVHDIEIDDEPYVNLDDIEIEDDELDDIVVMSDDDLDNEFSEEAEGSRKYGNRKMDEKVSWSMEDGLNEDEKHVGEYHKSRSVDRNASAGKKRASLMEVFRGSEDDDNKRTGTASGRNKYERQERAGDKRDNNKKDEEAKDKREADGRRGNKHKALSRMLSERNGRR